MESTLETRKSVFFPFYLRKGVTTDGNGRTQDESVVQPEGRFGGGKHTA
jgi:hypothetical protein